MPTEQSTTPEATAAVAPTSRAVGRDDDTSSLTAVPSSALDSFFGGFDQIFGEDGSDDDDDDDDDDDEDYDEDDDRTKGTFESTVNFDGHTTDGHTTDGHTTMDGKSASQAETSVSQRNGDTEYSSRSFTVKTDNDNDNGDDDDDDADNNGESRDTYDYATTSTGTDDVSNSNNKKNKYKKMLMESKKFKKGQNGENLSQFSFFEINIGGGNEEDSISLSDSDSLTDSDTDEDEDSIVSVDETFIFDRTDMAQRRTRLSGKPQPEAQRAQEKEDVAQASPGQFKDRWNEKLENKRYRLQVVDGEVKPETESREIGHRPLMLASSGDDRQEVDSSLQNGSAVTVQPIAQNGKAPSDTPPTSPGRVRSGISKLFRRKKSTKDGSDLSSQKGFHSPTPIDEYSIPGSISAMKSPATESQNINKKELIRQEKNVRKQAALERQMEKKKAAAAKRIASKEAKTAAALEKKMKNSKSKQGTVNNCMKLNSVTKLIKESDHLITEASPCGFEVHALHSARLEV